MWEFLLVDMWEFLLVESPALWDIWVYLMTPPPWWDIGLLQFLVCEANTFSSIFSIWLSCILSDLYDYLCNCNNPMSITEWNCWSYHNGQGFQRCWTNVSVTFLSDFKLWDCGPPLRQSLRNSSPWPPFNSWMKSCSCYWIPQCLIPYLFVPKCEVVLKPNWQ